MAKITEFGVEASSYDEYFASLRQKAHDAFGSPVNTSPELPLGQFLSAIALELAELDEGVVGVFNNQSLDSAIGRGLDNLAALSGLRREAGETNTALRRRARRQRGIAGTQTVPAMQSALDSMFGANNYIVLQNTQASPQVIDGITLLANSMYVGVADEGDHPVNNSTVVPIVGLHKPVGVALSASGNSHYDEQGVYEGAFGSFMVNWTYMISREVTVTVTATRTDQYPAGGDARLREYIQGRIAATPAGKDFDSNAALFGVYGLLGDVFTGIPSVTRVYKAHDDAPASAPVTAAHKVIADLNNGGVTLAITQ